MSRGVDASFSGRIALPENLEVAYRDADGTAQRLYLDRNHNETFALLHEDAHQDSRALTLPGMDESVLDVRLLSPLDLAVSKLGRSSSQDREDIMALARHGLIDANALRERAEEALTACVGDTSRVQNTVDMICRILEESHSWL